MQMEDDNRCTSTWNFPPEVNLLIFSQLPSVAELVKLRFVNKSFFKNVEDEYFWKVRRTGII